MAIVTLDDSRLEDIADAIRAKNGGSNTYMPSEMAAAIAAIPSGSSGGWTKVYEVTGYNFQTTSTSASQHNFLIESSLSYDKIYYIRIRDEAGPRNGYAYGSDALALPYKDDGSTAVSVFSIRYDNNGDVQTYRSTSLSSPAAYGVYPRSLTLVPNGISNLLVYCRYNATNSGTVDGDFTISVFEADFPVGYPSIFA